MNILNRILAANRKKSHYFLCMVKKIRFNKGNNLSKKEHHSLYSRISPG